MPSQPQGPVCTYVLLELRQMFDKPQGPKTTYVLSEIRQLPSQPMGPMATYVLSGIRQMPSQPQGPMSTYLIQDAGKCLASSKVLRLPMCYPGIRQTPRHISVLWLYWVVSTQANA